MQFDLSRLTLEDVGRFYTGLRTNDLKAMNETMVKAASEDDVVVDFLDLEYAEFNREVKAFRDADTALAQESTATEGFNVNLKKVTARRMDAYYAAIRDGDLNGILGVMRECMTPWPTADLTYGEYMGLLRAFMESVKKTASI